MNFVEIFLTSIGLAMDAFATAICKGLAIKEINLKKCFIVGGYFGLFQGLMPLIGFFLGTTVGNFILQIDHWIAFVLLAGIGGNLLINTNTKHNDKENEITIKTMIPLAIATSVDALAIGITFAFLKVKIIGSVFLIGTITFFLSFIGVKIGNNFGNKYEKGAKMFGGIILIVMAFKILLAHLGVI